MFHRFGNAVDQKGNALPGWQVECVQLADGETVIPIYSDELSTPIVGVSGVSNRSVADGAGNYDYFVLDGNYSEKFYDENGVYQGMIRYVSMYGAATEEIQDAVDAAQLAQQLAEATATAVIYESWTDLVAVTGSGDDTAIVFSDAGTHTDPVTSSTVNNAGLYQWNEPDGWKRISDTQAVIAESFATAAEESAASASEDANRADAAAELAVAGQQIYATKADATADLANISEGARVVVLVDESQGDNRTVYIKTSGVLDYLGVFGSFSGGTLSTKLTTAASSTSAAGLNISPAGTPPSSPSNGDIWPDGASLYYRLSGTNYQVAPLSSPSFTNVPTAPTAAPGTSTTQIATTAFVAAVKAVLDGDVGTLSTALTALSDSLSDYAQLSGADFTGAVSVGAASGGSEFEVHALGGDNDVHIDMWANGSVVGEIVRTATFMSVNTADTSPFNIYVNNVLVGQFATNGLQPRVVTAGSTSGTITPTSDTAGTYRAVGLTGAITLAVPSGTPVEAQELILYLKDNGSSRGITWTTTSGGFRAASGVSLPSATTAGKHVRIGCIWNSADSFWDVVAVVEQA